MSLSYFIYYRIQPEVAVSAAACVGDLFNKVERGAGVQGRLLTRRDEPSLWMEVFERVDARDTFERVLAAAVRESGIEHVLAPGGTRKLECFVD